MEHEKYATWIGEARRRMEDVEIMEENVLCV